MQIGTGSPQAVRAGIHSQPNLSGGSPPEKLAIDAAASNGSRLKKPNRFRVEFTNQPRGDDRIEWYAACEKPPHRRRRMLACSPPCRHVAARKDASKHHDDTSDLKHVKCRGLLVETANHSTRSSSDSYGHFGTGDRRGRSPVHPTWSVFRAPGDPRDSPVLGAGSREHSGCSTGAHEVLRLLVEPQEGQHLAPQRYIGSSRKRPPADALPSAFREISHGRVSDAFGVLVAEGLAR